ncbi:intercellular adhesin biosynthesis polysaccharide N-deacetylase [Terribacillus aidingensis]|uniref:Intercellular adhesin biosynthesis polysaccharide N-deacetylase n=1 Tax=Terribacillus aidingensis TaxID=586416 RepID=A0A285NXM8_9BACI|nr:polysaccharide deacetylase family protein [Terribacillus aidingensis]SNZ14242.1 intercellular adhesin biosynthesis polysaccharide N-deacetylase [Terribacillus aidingensis]
MKKILLILTIVCVVGLITFRAIHLYEADEAEETNIDHALNKDGCLGLNYHRVRQPTVFNKTVSLVTRSDELTRYSVYKDDFEEQLQQLKALDATFVTPEELSKYQQDGKFPERCVWISFDDIDRTVYENAFPILEQENIPFTLYVIAGHVGDDNFQNLQMATWPQLQEMVDSGLAAIGSHTYDMHRLEADKPLFLDNKNLEAFRKDLKKSVQTIEENLNVTPSSFAYPYGNTNDAVAKIVEDVGFKQAAILAPQSITPNDYPYYLNRIVTNPDTFHAVILPYLEAQKKG